MNPLKKKELLKEAFRKKNNERIRQNKALLTVDKLDLKFEQSTFEWFRHINGGIHEND